MRTILHPATGETVPPPTALERLLAPVERGAFRERYHGREALLIRGNGRTFADLFAWEDLNRLLNALSYPHPYVHAVTPGRDDETPGSHSLVERCRAGASLRLSQAQRFDPKVGALARALEAETGQPVMVTLFLSQPAHAALGRHYDLGDAFVLQLEGHKAWTVYEPTFEKPIPGYFGDFYESPSHRLLLQCELAPGDVLYIPRGFWHQALAQRELSLHLTVSLVPRTGIGFLTWLVDQLRSDVRFREELPLSFTDEPAELRETRLREHVAPLGTVLLSQMADAATIRAYHRDGLLPERDASRLELPEGILEAAGE